MTGGDAPNPEGGRQRPPTFLDAMLTVIVLIGLIALTISLFGVSATDGPLQVALLLSSAFASLIAFKERLQLGCDRRRGNRRGRDGNERDLHPARGRSSDRNLEHGRHHPDGCRLLPARMSRGEFERRGLEPQILSRAVEDSGTVTSVLVPWNTCGAYISGVPGVSTASYFPYCFFNLLSPILDVVYGFIGFKVPSSRDVEETPSQPTVPTPARG
jgi:Na+/H+ antiporter family